MTAKLPLIIGIGELLWDMLPAGKRAGGAPANFVYHAARAGAQGYVVSAVGQDALGDELLQELEKNKIGHCLSRVPYPTGTVKVTLKNGIPDYEIVENVAWDHIRVSKEAAALMKKADAVCFGTLASRSPESRRTIETLLSYTPEKALRFFDINLRGNYYSYGLIDTLLKKSNIFKINDEELTVLQNLFHLPAQEEQACMELLQRYGLRCVILTAGERHSCIYATDEKSFLPTPKVQVADTVGAGDSFSGAFTTSILTGKSLKEAHAAAVRTAAFVSSRSGAWPIYE
ncbi:MAG: carbohydrate kinase [Alphaproteobacteria bacterium]|nr:carbohydrate kinase [Alphaproteobacteria bacterium]